jgi:MoxR-like ATPase
MNPRKRFQHVSPCGRTFTRGPPQSIALESRMPSELQVVLHRLEDSIGQVVLGKSEVVRNCLVALLAGEHVLLEDVPGVGKTLVGKALAKSVSGEFTRVQFTPDLLPSDIVGSSVFNQKAAEFVYNRGPVFANIVLADEINRAPPRTQAALLEAMSEGQVSVDGQTYPLPKPFLVIATQNPFEFEGTYALPESQLDRFLMRISMGYPGREHDRNILVAHRRGDPTMEMHAVIRPEQVVQLQHAVRDIKVEQSVADYLLDIVHATRETETLHVGVSTRGALSLYRACQALAFLENRDFATPDDVKRLAVPVLSHRVIAKGYLQGTQRDMVEGLVRRIVEGVAAPV